VGHALAEMGAATGSVVAAAILSVLAAIAYFFTRS
jgi:hypothetical protein